MWTAILRLSLPSLGLAQHPCRKCSSADKLAMNVQFSAYIHGLRLAAPAKTLGRFAFQLFSR